MIRISDTVVDLVRGNAFLRFGLYHQLLNLTQVARFVRPMVEARTRKPVRTSAITMALSRLQREISDAPEAAPRFALERINLHAGLCILTFPKSTDIHRNLEAVYSHLTRDGAYMTLTEGTAEITIIFDRSYLTFVLGLVTVTPAGRHDHVSALGVRFDRLYANTPGLIYEILQQLAIQRINVVEIASTGTELNIYLREVDVRRAFDSLYAQFVASSSR